LNAFEGMQAWSIADNVTVRRSATAWEIGRLTATALSVGADKVVGARGARVAPPAGGATIDVRHEQQSRRC
jgi:hypothetical protein